MRVCSPVRGEVLGLKTDEQTSPETNADLKDKGVGVRKRIPAMTTSYVCIYRDGSCLRGEWYLQ
jgi:hypothetical protein